MARDTDSARRSLIRATQKGGVTLVLGAGISIPRRIPNWNDLAKAVWNDVLKDKPSPWSSKNDASSPKDLPQFLPIVFERTYRTLKDESKFFEVLKKHLYAEALFPLQDSTFTRSGEVLAVLARLIVNEHKRGNSRRSVEHREIATHSCRPRLLARSFVRRIVYSYEPLFRFTMSTVFCPPIYGRESSVSSGCWYSLTRNTGRHPPTPSHSPIAS